MYSISNFKKRKRKERKSRVSKFLFSRSYFFLMRNALDSMQYFPWQQPVQLPHLRRDMVLQQKKKTKEGSWEIWRFWRTKNSSVSWKHLQRAHVLEALTGAHLFSDSPYQVAPAARADARQADCTQGTGPRISHCRLNTHIPFLDSGHVTQ